MFAIVRFLLWHALLVVGILHTSRLHKAHLMHLCAAVDMVKRVYFSSFAAHHWVSLQTYFVLSMNVVNIQHRNDDYTREHI